jgi:NMD protein affecting ribosome stability and mRNA decay
MPQAEIQLIECYNCGRYTDLHATLSVNDDEYLVLCPDCFSQARKNYAATCLFCDEELTEEDTS